MRIERPPASPGHPELIPTALPAHRFCSRVAPRFAGRPRSNGELPFVMDGGGGGGRPKRNAPPPVRFQAEPKAGRLSGAGGAPAGAARREPGVKSKRGAAAPTDKAADGRARARAEVGDDAPDDAADAAAAPANAAAPEAGGGGVTETILRSAVDLAGASSSCGSTRSRRTPTPASRRWPTRSRRCSRSAAAANAPSACGRSRRPRATRSPPPGSLAATAAPSRARRAPT